MVHKIGRTGLKTPTLSEILIIRLENYNHKNKKNQFENYFGKITRQHALYVRIAQDSS